MNDNNTDILWWNAFKDGDRQAFDNLFRRYYPVLLQYGMRITTDKELINDSIQDLFIELWQSRSSTSVQSVKAYLLKALKYKLFRQFRSNSTTQTTEGDIENHFELSHDQFIMAREDEAAMVKKMVAAINQLPNRQKEIIYLKIYQGLNYEELSEVMGINYQVARNLFYQSIKSLRQILQ
ncbi:MAG TPA: sigma-70 family RNA polymerase sigma factor [Chitinophagaceae bacterium]|nr:sigma-70 family RNA polymerase sigma factor [Chitinophagaceae bacterium]